MEDTLDLLRWRNDAVTRANSRFPGLVSTDEHIQWLSSAVGSRYDRIFIAEHDGGLIGMGRLQTREPELEVSLTVSPEHRGHGYARQIIAALIDEAPRSVLIAQVGATNRRSLVAFIQEGFLPVDMSHFADRPQWVWFRRTP